MDIGKMKLHYLLYIQDILEVCPLILKVAQQIVRQIAILPFLFIQVPPHSLSTSTNLLLRTNDNTSNMENKE